MPYNAFLRRLRVKWTLSQGELAELLDISQARISRYETGEEHPTLGVALGLQVVFGRGPRSVFYHLYSSVEEATMRRAAEFERRLSGLCDFPSMKKRQLLEAMVARATKPDEA
jgi:transcriptional regulator with XRE-family HTH domain